MKYEYSVQIVWSEEDGAYLAAIPELPGCVADGETIEQALQNVKIVGQQWIEVATEEKREIPRPMSQEDWNKALAKTQAEFDRTIKSYIEQEVSKTVAHIVEKMQSRAFCPTTAWRGRGSFVFTHEH